MLEARGAIALDSS